MVARSIELSVPGGRRPRLQDAIVHRVADLLLVDVTARGPQPVTTAARTVIDIASLVTPRQLEEALDGARRRGQVYLPFLRIVRDAFLPPPRVQVERRDSGRRMRLDATTTSCSSPRSPATAHATRRQRQSDAERRARLVAMGLRVVDFTYEDVRERPPYVAVTLGRLLGLEPYLDGLSA